MIELVDVKNIVLAFTGNAKDLKRKGFENIKDIPNYFYKKIYISGMNAGSILVCDNEIALHIDNERCKEILQLNDESIINNEINNPIKIISILKERNIKVFDDNELILKQLRLKESENRK